MRLFPSQRSHGRVALLRDRGETTHPPFLAVAQERDPPVPSSQFPVPRFTNSSVKDLITPKGLGRFGKARVFFLPLCLAKHMSPLLIVSEFLGGATTLFPNFFQLFVISCQNLRFSAILNLGYPRDNPVETLIQALPTRVAQVLPSLSV